MKKSIVVSLFLLSGFVFAKPAIKFKNTVVDFGEVNSGKSIDIVFEFENTGTEILLITRVTPSCGCTTAALEKKEYKPGEKGAITSKFNSTNYSGRIIKTITVVSNDADTPEVRLTMRGNVVIKDFSQAAIKPDNIYFGSVKTGKRYVRKLTLSSTGNQELRILEIMCGPEVSVSFETNKVAAKKSTEIALAFTPFDKGVFNNMVKIRTNDYRSPYIFVRLEAEAK